MVSVVIPGVMDSSALFTTTAYCHWLPPACWRVHQRAQGPKYGFRYWNWHKETSNTFEFVQLEELNVQTVLFLPSVITTLTRVMMSAYALSIPTQNTPVSSNWSPLTFTNSPLRLASIISDLCVFLVLARPSESTKISQVLLESPWHQYFLLYRNCLVSYLQIRMKSPPMCAVICS